MSKNKFTNFYKNSLSKLSKSLFEDEASNDLSLGKYNTYIYAISTQASKKLFYISIPVKTENSFKNKDLLRFLDLIKEKNKYIQSVSYENSSINMKLKLGWSHNKFRKRLNSSLDEITCYLNSQKYYSSCGLCGAEAALNLYSINFKPFLYCDTCMEAAEQDLLRLEEKLKTAPSIKARAVFAGIFAGLLPALLWTISLVYFGLNSWIFPAFIAASISYSFAKYNRQWNNKARLVLSLIVLASTSLTTNLITGLSIYRSITSQTSKVGFSKALQETLKVFIDDKSLLLLNPKILLISLVSLGIVFINITGDYRKQTSIYKNFK